MTALGMVIASQASAAHPFVDWPDHNYTTSDPGSFEPDNVCQGNETPLEDNCWVTLPGLSDPIYNTRGGINPRSADITSGQPDGSFPSIFFSYDDLSSYPQEMQDQNPDGMVFLRMRLRGSPVRNNVNDPQVPFGGQAAWHFLFDTVGDGWANFIAQTYGQPNTINLFFNDLVTRQVSGGETGDSCQDGGVRLWQETTGLRAGAVGCGGNDEAYCDWGYTRVINKEAYAATQGQDHFLDMQFPLHLFRDCRESTENDYEQPDPDGGSPLYTVQGDPAFDPYQPFLLCASTGTQINDMFAKDFASNISNYEPDVDEPVACSDPCTLAGGCEEGVIILETDATCGTGPNNSPVELNTRVLSTIDTDGNDLISTVETITFEYWQLGVSTDWEMAIPDAGSSNPVTEPGDQINEFSMFWDTTGLDYSQGSMFQVRVIAEDIYGNEVAETLLEYDVAQCDGSAVPVTLAHFGSSNDRGQLDIEWTTAMEMDNLGFNLYGETRNGGWHLLNKDLIESHAVDSVRPQHYEFSVRRNDIQRIFLEDVSTRGIPELHGPFAVGEAAGRVPQVEAIDWDGVRVQSNLSRDAARSRGWRQQEYDPVRLLVDSDGVYRVSYADLVAAGLDLGGVPVAQIGITNRGEPVPMYTEARGRFGPGDFIEFYGESLDTLYTDTNVYVLHVDNHSSVRMSKGNGAGMGRGQVAFATEYTDTFRLAREREYANSAVIDNPWFDTRMRVTSSARKWDFDFAVDNVQPGSSRLSLEMFGMTDWTDVNPDHHVEIYVNGKPVDERTWNGRQIQQVEVELPRGLIREGDNRLTIRLPASTGVPAAAVGLTEFSVDYPRALEARDGFLRFSSDDGAFKVTGLTTNEPVVYRIEDDQVTRLSRVQVSGNGPYTATFTGTGSEATYVIGDPESFPSPGLEPGWSATDITSGQADYLMISHPAFIDSLQSLVSYHETRGRTVKVVDVNDIYDQFGDGIFDASAIQSYIRATADSMGYGHVLLVGGDTYDYKDNLGSGSISFIPSLYAATDNRIRFAPVDALYVDLDGNEIPDLPIGRMPVRTPAELEEIIQKTIDYANRDYRETAILASDLAEPGVSFADELEAFTASGLDGWTAHRAHLDDLSLAQARSNLFKGIDQGSSLTAYLGHSGYGVWTFSGLFSSSDVQDLANHGRPTAIAQWGCWNTYHVLPEYNTMGHSFMLSEDRGAAIVMGSSTYSHVNSGRALGELLLPKLTQSGQTAGQAMTEAKQALAADYPHMRDAILGWTILGDPAIMIGD